MKIEKFEDIVAWQKAERLTNAIYAVTRDLKDYSFRDQIRRASISIMNNIAEGFERQTNKELKQFLFIAKGSCGEVRSMLYIAREQRYISEVQYNEFYPLSVEIAKMLSKFITAIKT